MKIVDRHGPREFAYFAANSGIVLCDKDEGAFLVLRFAEDVERLRALLQTIDVVRLPREEDPK